MSTRLIIARHGNTFAAGEMPRRVGTTDLPLAQSGLEQGKQLGSYLKNNGLVPDIIFSSKLKRALQTAEQAQYSMKTSLAIQTSEIFNEIDYGPDENQLETQVIERIGESALKEWESEAKVPPGWLVEPETIIKNWWSFAEKIHNEYPDQTCLVITSNGIARFSPYLTGDFQQFRRFNGIKIATGAACLFTKTGDEARWSCQFWNVRPN